MRANHLALYFDDPPVDARSDGRGLGPINSRMLELFAPGTVIVNVMRLRANQILFRPAGPRYVTILDSFPGASVRAAGRINRRMTTWLERALIGVARCPPPLEERYIFAPVGSDIGSIHRAVRIAEKTDCRLLLYLVDDPLDAMRAAGGRRSRQQIAWLTAMLNECAVVYGITQPLCDLLRTAHGIDARYLPLPYTYDPSIVPQDNKNQIVYLGSVNEIYAHELAYWIALLGRIGFFGDGGTLLVTGDIAAQPGIVRRRFPSRAALEQEIANSRATLLPISSRESTLCFSSFPSKTLDYLAFSRLILASAPNGSIVADFFRQAGLPYCFAESAVPEELVRELLASDDNRSPAYRDVLDRGFSGTQFVATVRNGAAPA